MPQPARRRALLVLPLVTAALALSAGPALASSPPSDTVAAPAVGAADSVTWTGTVPVGADPTSTCDTATQADTHTTTITIPAGHYDAATTKARFSISWSDASNDEIIQVDGPNGISRVSDTSAATEAVEIIDPPAGDYTITACPYLSTTPQAYTGKVLLSSTSKAGAASADLPSADAHGLEFSASVPSDPQRDVSEPLIEIDPSGRSYTCGPTGFSNASDYSNTSDDGGDQFHLLGSPPRGQQGTGGGGDCGLGTGVTKNAEGNYQYAYAGLGPLTGFTTSSSADNGKTLQNGGPQGNFNTDKGGLADRQWLTFLDDKTVLLNYNQQQPRNIVVQKSTDGGMTYPLPTNSAIAGHSPDFPGPMRSMPASVVTPGASGRIAFFAWNSSDADFSYVNLSVSDASGLNWKDCLVKKIPIADGALQAFTVADSDSAGNVYVAYADEKDFHTYLSTLAADDVKNCDRAVDQDPNATQLPPTKNPGFSTPLQVDRDAVHTTIFPWLVAGGAPGHVALSFYGTETDGDPNPGSFKAAWNVYVDQLTDAPIGSAHNADVATAQVGQVKATTHPIHYDSICLLGLGCDLSTPAGDRGLGDFFAIDVDHKTHKLELVYNNTAKLPDAPVGSIAAPNVVTQTAGPSNDGGSVTPEADRATVRTTASDPAGDALVDYSELNPAGPVAPLSGTQTNVPALDLLDERVTSEVDPGTGLAVANGGFTVTFRVKDLSDAALQSALTASKAGSLVYAFRFVNGYQPAAAVAKYDGSAFSFGFDDYTTASAQCGSSSDKCEIYPGNTPIKGRVDRGTGTIVLSVPRSVLTPLKGSTGPGQRPTETAAGTAVPGDRFYDATTFSFANPSADPSTQTFMVNADNVRAMDFLLPAVTPPGTVPEGGILPPPPPATAPPAATPGAAPGGSATGAGGPTAPTTTKPKPARRKSSARLRIVRVVRRGSRVLVTLRTSNGSIRGARITITRNRHVIARVTSKRIGVKGLRVTVRARRGAAFTRRGRLIRGTYRITATATGASKARAGGVILLS